MKRLLLSCLLLMAASSAHAQLAQLVTNGIMLGIRASKNGGQPQDDQLYVKPANYNGQAFTQKRTPAARRPSKGGAQIVALEQLLAARHTALLADATTPILDDAWETQYAAALQALATTRPTWSLASYGDEVDFYRLQNGRRLRAQQAAPPPAPAAARPDSAARPQPAPASSPAPPKAASGRP